LSSDPHNSLYGQLFVISSYTTLASYLVEILIVELHYNATGG